MVDRGSTALLLLVAAGCAIGGRQGVLVPVAPPVQPVAQLLADLQSPAPGVRAAAAWALTGVAAPDQVASDALRAAYADRDERVREAAAWALGHIQAAGTELNPSLYDEPPKAVRVTRPRYPRHAHYTQVEGTVLVEILIGASGRVVHAEVRRSIPGLDAAALDCVKQWAFAPARLAGTPVPALANAPVTFRLH